MWGPSRRIGDTMLGLWLVAVTCLLQEDLFFPTDSC
jgi:hypothetical protein